MKKIRKIFAGILAFCSIFSCFTFSGCLMHDFVVSCRGFMQAKEKEEQERRARLDGIKSEVDYPYILVGDYTVTVVNKAAERTEINFSSIAQGFTLKRAILR